MNGILSAIIETLSPSRFPSGSGLIKAFISGLHLQTSFTGLTISPTEFPSTCSSIVFRLETLRLEIPSTSRSIPSLADTTVYFSELIQAGKILNLTENHPTCDRPSQFVFSDICRIALYASTSTRSGIHMEVWLPRNWTGRFLSTGNGGLSGCIQYEDMAYASALGIATVGANNGHNGTSGEAFLNNPDIIEDYAYRSVHTSTQIAKSILQTFYGTPHTKSYYLGCSTGGRQGLKSIQDFPDDFDGVIAGAPANAFSGLLSWSGRHYSIIGPSDSNNPSFITEKQWADLIHPDIMNQCDTIDDVADGVIEDPSLCDYKPERLICSSGAKDKTKCLSGEQAKAIRKIFSPLYGPEGDLWYPRQTPGSEDAVTRKAMYSGKPFPYTADWFRYALYSNPNFDVTKLNMADWAFSQSSNPFNINTWEGDLTPFRSRNGKLLTWHGQADGLISPASSERYYTHISHTMNIPPSELDSFYRLFRVSGTGHCRGGEGAWVIGQTLRNIGLSVNTTHPARGLLDDSDFLNPDANVLTAMIRWVEEGKAPDTLLGRKYVNESKALGVQSSRRHCRYPFRNQYVGKGDSTNPESWVCRQSFVVQFYSENIHTLPNNEARLYHYDWTDL